ncbi:hypothetical protein Goklo_023422 [Gossypium klotzschianum]|uniref:DUF4283 domain-containing protein n=1 Tax=Gossypium klotzschianum TaxID=34286 RepID=A0A7J8TQQ3_9ROSI|nr:hypothetical protein [Gossypium klotzschianum]
MEKELANLNIEDGEEEALILPTDGNTMKNLWNLLGGVQISDLGGKRYLLKIFHELDIEREEEDPMEVPLVFSAFWIQVHDLIPGFFSESMEKLFGDFIREFIDYDTYSGIEGDGNGIGLNIEGEHKKGINNEQCLASDLMRGESGMVMNPILGFNLKGYKIQADNINTGPFNQMDRVNMEGSSIESGDAKKRPRFENVDLGVSV